MLWLKIQGIHPSKITSDSFVSLNTLVLLLIAKLFYILSHRGDAKQNIS